MAYRLHEHKKPEQRRTAVDIATPIKLYVHNGTSANFAFPCWYQEVLPPVPAKLHNRSLHDYHGWPNPRHPDHSCQLWIPDRPHHCVHGFKECSPFCKHYIDYKRVVPIHLTSDYEGYTGSEVAWVDKPEGITISSSIDDVEDWVVRVHVDCLDPAALEEPQKYKFTVFVNNEDDEDRKMYRRDIVALAELIVLPSAYTTEVNNG